MDFEVCQSMLLLRAIRILGFRCSALRVRPGWTKRFLLYLHNFLLVLKVFIRSILFYDNFGVIDIVVVRPPNSMINLSVLCERSPLLVQSSRGRAKGSS
jgi:hypothetical protein